MSRATEVKRRGDGTCRTSHCLLPAVRDGLCDYHVPERELLRVNGLIADAEKRLIRLKTRRSELLKRCKEN